MEIDNVARALCWVLHRDLGQALSQHAEPIIRRILHGGMATQRIPGSGPGSHRA
jgi:hypothetical protein